MPKVFATLDRVGESHGMRGTPEWLSTHPDPGNRIANIEARIQKLPPDLMNGTVGRRQYLAKLQGLVFGDDPRQGYTIGQDYYHPELAFKFAFPEGWRIVNQRSAVGALSPQRDAAVVLTLSQQQTPREAFDAFFSQQGIQKGPNRGRDLYTFRAIDAQTGAPSAQGLIGFLNHDGRVYQLMGYTAVNSYDGYERAMHGSLASFSKVTARKYLEVDPATIEIVRVPGRMTFAQFANRFPSSIELDQLALINGVREDTVLEEGSFVKRVVGGELPER
jgi:predicted Zn-dependent protease